MKRGALSPPGVKHADLSCADRRHILADVAASMIRAQRSAVILRRIQAGVHTILELQRQSSASSMTDCCSNPGCLELIQLRPDTSPSRTDGQDALAAADACLLRRRLGHRRVHRPAAERRAPADRDAHSGAARVRVRVRVRGKIKLGLGQRAGQGLLRVLVRTGRTGTRQRQCLCRMWRAGCRCKIEKG